MRIVGLDEYVVDGDAVTEFERARVFENAEPEVSLQDLARRDFCARPMVLDFGLILHGRVVVESIEQHRDPADPTLRHHDLQIRMPHRDPGEEPVDAVDRGVEREKDGAGLDWRLLRWLQHGPGRADVETDDGLCFFTRGKKGRQCLSSYSDGNPRVSVFCGKVTALKPLSAFLWISTAAASGSGSQASWQGMIRSGYEPAQ